MSDNKSANEKLKNNKKKVKNESNIKKKKKKEEVRKQLKISFIQKIWMFIKRILNL